MATSTAGTTVSDFMDRTLKLGYPAGAALLLCLLAVLFLGWRLSGESLSVQSVHNRKVELFYWGAILISNTLGTAMGDFLADSSGLGFGGGALLVGSLIGIVTFAHFRTRLSQTFLFWAAFVLTRPFGATMGDLLTKTHEKGGLGFGTIGASAVLASVLVVLVARDGHRQRGLPSR